MTEDETAKVHRILAALQSVLAELDDVGFAVAAAHVQEALDAASKATEAAGRDLTEAAGTLSKRSGSATHH